MSTVEIIEDQIRNLDNQLFATLRNWFIEYEHVRWDRSHAPAWERNSLAAPAATSDRDERSYSAGHRQALKLHQLGSIRHDAGASGAEFPRWSMGTI